MKYTTYIVKYLAVAAMLVISLTATAQSLRTGYFLKGYSYRHKINPALVGEQNFVSIPMIGSTSLKTMGSLGLSNFIYDSADGNGLVTFMHPSIDANEFLSKIADNNRLALEYDMNILSTGFSCFGGYNTIDIALHSHTALNVPYDMFRFLKTLGGGVYDFTNFNITSRNYLDIALGHSRKLNDDLTLGVRLKALLGVAYADLLLEKMNVELTGERWMIEAQGNVSAAFGSRFTYDEDGMLDGLDDFAFGIQGFGLGIDLGAEYDFRSLGAEGLTISASITDLGFMRWKNVSSARIASEPYVFDGFDEISIGGEDGASIGEQLEGIGEDIADMFVLGDNGIAGKSEMLSATLNIGLEYKMPFYDKMSAALLFSNRFNKLYPYYELSLILNISPLKWLDFAISGTNTNLGTGMGAMLNVHFTGFSLFVGSDCFMGAVNKQYIPLKNINSSISFGVNIPFGKKKKDDWNDDTWEKNSDWEY